MADRSGSKKRVVRYGHSQPAILTAAVSMWLPWTILYILLTPQRVNCSGTRLNSEVQWLVHPQLVPMASCILGHLEMKCLPSMAPTALFCGVLPPTIGFGRDLYYLMMSCILGI